MKESFLKFRLAKDCPFYIDWSDKFDVLFSHILCAFKLEVGTDRVRIESNTRIFACVTQLLAYLLGGEANGFVNFSARGVSRNF